MKKLLLLWSPLADYSVSSIAQLATKPDIELYLVYQPSESNAPYANLDISFCKQSFEYGEGKGAELERFCYDLNPDTIIMASWGYSIYMKITKECRKRGTYVVSVFDRQWVGSPKQWLGVATSSIFLKPSIDNFFVSGDRQAELAHKLGYSNPYIGYNCANTARFENIIPSSKRNFIFVGRLVEIKGIKFLLKAYARYRTTTDNPWDLHLCGKGELESLCQNQPGVKLLGFTQPAELPARLAEASCLVLPSLFEPWGLVVHEAAAAGLAIIASHIVGATTYYVRDGQNGYIINPDEQSLLRAMRLVSEASATKLAAMQKTSKELASQWTTEKWADYVYENICIKENQIRQLAS